MPETVQTPSPDASLQAFLANADPQAALRLRTLANAWQGGGGQVFVGKIAVRLLGADTQGRGFTAGTLHHAHGVPPGPNLELGRVLLQAHGVSQNAWTEWCDERPELRPLGFDRDAKFPMVRLDTMPDAALARLAAGLRDLARLVTPSP